MPHFLILNSHCFPDLEEPTVEGWRYDRVQGLWCDIAAENGSSPDPKPRPKPVSKKCDMETGEDMKGP